MLLWAILLASPLPADLPEWLELAEQLSPREQQCPPGQPCAQVSRVQVSGSVAAGAIEVAVQGHNLGQKDQTFETLSPADVLAAQEANCTPNRGDLRLRDNRWFLNVPPGNFKCTFRVTFSPAPNVPFSFAGPVALFEDNLRVGALASDELGANHGGSMYLQMKGRQTGKATTPTLRITRLFTYGTVTTFTYAFEISGLHEQQRVKLPLLGDETVEAGNDGIPFTQEDGFLLITAPPGETAFRVSGYFSQSPGTLTKPDRTSFEYWLADSQDASPAEFTTDGVEIDPDEITGVNASERARGFFLTERQSLNIHPLNVRVDRGRQGSATVEWNYFQGLDTQWIGRLTVAPESIPENGRLRIRTPKTAHFASVDDDPTRILLDEGLVSLKADSDPNHKPKAEVEWREAVPLNPFLAVARFDLPPQELYISQLSAKLRFLPGYDPLLVMGADHADGHLVDGLHLYALLLAILGFVLARLARISAAGQWVAAALLLALYSVPGFPKTPLLLLLALAAIGSRLGRSELSFIAKSHLLQGLTRSILIAVALGTLATASDYIGGRLDAAFFPWRSLGHGEHISNAGTFENFGGHAPQAEMDLSQSSSSRQAPSPDKKSKMVKKSYGSMRSQGYLKAMAMEKNLKTVQFADTRLPGNETHFGLAGVPNNQPRQVQIVTVGPWLRGIWLLAESILLAALLAVLLGRMKRLWSAS